MSIFKRLNVHQEHETILYAILRAPPQLVEIPKLLLWQTKMTNKWLQIIALLYGGRTQSPDSLYWVLTILGSDNSTVGKIRQQYPKSENLTGFQFLFLSRFRLENSKLCLNLNCPSLWEADKLFYLCMTRD